MKSIFSVYRLTSVLMMIPVLCFPLTAIAELISGEMMSADYCDVRNPGGAPALEGTRKQDGEIQNILPDFQFTISCPLQIQFDSSSYDIGVVALNYNSVTQGFKCVLQEFNISDFLVASYPTTLKIGPGFYDIISFSNIELENNGNRLYMWCALPPRGALGSLVVDSYR